MPSTFLIKARYHYAITPLGNPAFFCSPISYTCACPLSQQGERLSAVPLCRCKNTAWTGGSWAVWTHTHLYNTEVLLSLSWLHFLNAIMYSSAYFSSQLLKMGYHVMEKHNTDFEGLQNPKEISLWEISSSFLYWVLISSPDVFCVTSYKEPTQRKIIISFLLLVYQPSPMTYTWSKNYHAQE